MQVLREKGINAEQAEQLLEYALQNRLCGIQQEKAVGATEIKGRCYWVGKVLSTGAAHMCPCCSGRDRIWMKEPSSKNLGDILDDESLRASLIQAPQQIDSDADAELAQDASSKPLNTQAIDGKDGLGLLVNPNWE